MTGDDSSDGMEELQELLALYAGKEERYNKNEKIVNTKSSKEPTYVEVPMEKVIFGDKSKFLSNLTSSTTNHKEIDNISEDTENNDNAKKRKAAWSDSDDEDLQVGDVKRETRHTGPLNHLRKDKSYKEYLTARFTRTINEPKWALLNKKSENSRDSDDSDDEPLLKSVGFIEHSQKGGELRPKNLTFRRVKDLNRATYAEGQVKSVQFHPSSTAALVAGLSCVATIYSVNGQANEKLHNIRFSKFPIKCARISPCGSKAYFGSSMPFYYVYDLLEAQETKLRLPNDIRAFWKFEISPCGKYIASAGKFGTIHLFAAKSNELLHSFKQEGFVQGLCFTADSQRLLVSGSSNAVNILSLRQNRIEHSFVDDGCINGNVVDLSPNQRLLATGSREGVVNVYDYESVFQSSTPMPEKSFMNLRTCISDVKFNHSSELLAMCSHQAPNAVRLAHFPSATVYANFPDTQLNIGHASSIAFSTGSGYLAFGMQGKSVPLFRLKHFKNF